MIGAVVGALVIIGLASAVCGWWHLPRLGVPLTPLRRRRERPAAPPAPPSPPGPCRAVRRPSWAAGQAP